MRKISLLSIALLALAGCGQDADSSSWGGGLEANQDQDQVTAQSIEGLKKVLKDAIKCEQFTYDVTSSVTGSESHFIQYFDRDCWYNLEDDDEASFGLALGSDQKLFKFYLDKKGNPTPSLFRYTKYNSADGEPGIDDTLYGPLNIAHINLLTEDVIDKMDVSKVSSNRYLIKDGSVTSVFQYMSTYGSSITNYMTATYIEIIPDTLQFKVTLDLGEYGDITATFSPNQEDTFFLDKAEKEVKDGTMKGVEYYPDVKDFLDRTNDNNYQLHGVQYVATTGSINEGTSDIYVNQNYFFVKYKENYSSYHNFGYVFVPYGTSIELYSFNQDGSVNTSAHTTSQLRYDACYEYREQDGKFYFVNLVGPLENSSTTYIDVSKDGLSSVTDPDKDKLYIAKDESGVKKIYRWTAQDGGTSYAWEVYSDWYTSAGDFGLGGYSESASYYLKSSGLSIFGKNYFEKDRDGVKDRYVSTDSSVLSTLGNGLFAYGFQSTGTWVSNIVSSYLKLYKNGETIESADIGLLVNADAGDGYRKQDIFYRLDNIGQGSFSRVEDWLTQEGVNF